MTRAPARAGRQPRRADEATVLGRPDGLDSATRVFYRLSPPRLCGASRRRLKKRRIGHRITNANAANTATSSPRMPPQAEARAGADIGDCGSCRAQGHDRDDVHSLATEPACPSLPSHGDSRNSGTSRPGSMPWTVVTIGMKLVRTPPRMGLTYSHTTSPSESPRAGDHRPTRSSAYCHSQPLLIRTRMLYKGRSASPV